MHNLGSKVTASKSVQNNEGHRKNTASTIRLISKIHISERELFSPVWNHHWIDGWC